MTSTAFYNSDRPEGLLAVWRFRELLRNLTLRNLKIKYQRSALGFFWTLLNPLAMVAVLVVVFSRIIRIPVEHYWAFLISGYFAWSFIMQILSSGTYVLNEHAALRRSVAFPTEVLVLSTAASRLVEFLAELMLVMLVLIVFHHQGVPLAIVLVPLLVVFQVMIALGLMMPLATAAVFYTDIQHALPVVLLTLFYISPVFYPMHLVPEGMRPFYAVNPLAGMLTLYHVVLYEGRFPSLQLLGGTAVVAVLLFAAGYAIFHKYTRVFAELV